MKPPKSILDKGFKYRSSHATDVSRTWAEARKKLEQDKKDREELRSKIEQLPTIGKRERKA